MRLTRSAFNNPSGALTRAVLATAWIALATSAAAQKIPERLTDAAFWSMAVDFSEPDGFFQSNNFVSNETYFQYVIPELARTLKPGGIYMGVGPDQNYTYIAALKPQMVFIVDIRRQNMMQHLMFKALMEMSANRADFVTRLFSRIKPSGLTDSSSANDILDAVWRAPRDLKLFESNLAAIKEVLIAKHGFALSENDQRSLAFVYESFYQIGPGITYQGSSGQPTYWDLMVETDAAGVHGSYLANEANYRVLKDLHAKNLIVPLVGDFGGPKAIRKVAEYLKDKGVIVSAFYLSNVEQYLFQSDAWLRFYPNVGELPLDSTSTFIRSLFNSQGRNAGSTRRPVSLLASMVEQIRAFKESKLTSYWQVIDTSRQ